MFFFLLFYYITSLYILYTLFNILPLSSALIYINIFSLRCQHFFRIFLLFFNFSYNLNINLFYSTFLLKQKRTLLTFFIKFYNIRFILFILNFQFLYCWFFYLLFYSSLSSIFYTSFKIYSYYPSNASTYHPYCYHCNCICIYRIIHH